jgi:hypothetical protein
MSGDKSGLKEMIQALKRKDRNCLRYFTATALADSGALVAIPDLIEALKDPWQAPRGSEIGEYPVREAAALALLGMGVDVTTPAGISLNTRTQPSYLVQGKAPDATELGDYRAVKGDAVRAIAKELASKDSETVAMAIKAIARVGGSEAKAELERFISENAGKPLQSLYVTIARECLSQIKP